MSGLLGAGIAASQIYQERRYEEWVQAFVAQGQPLSTAQQSALNAMGLRVPPGTPTRRTYLQGTAFWLVVLAAYVFFVVTMWITAPATFGAGTVLISCLLVGYCLKRLGKNLHHLG